MRKNISARDAVVDPSELIRARICDAIGGRDKAVAVQRASDGAFQYKTLHNWIDGKTFPSVKALSELATFLGKDPDYFLIAPRAGELVIQHLDVRAAAGAGSQNWIEATSEDLVFPEWMIKKLTDNAARLRLLRASGDSMEPLFGDGALLLVDERDRDTKKLRKAKKAWERPNIFVFLQDGQLRVKQLRHNAAGALIVMSENRAYDPEMLQGHALNDIKIMGRVIWWDNRL